MSVSSQETKMAPKTKQTKEVNKKQSKKRHPHFGHRERIRKRFIKGGFEGFHDHEVLELVLHYCMPQVNTNEFGHNLIDKFGSFAKVMDADIKHLVQIEGITERTAVFFNLIPKLLKYYEISKLKEKSVISDTDGAGQYAMSLFKDAVYESLYIFCLNTANKLICSPLIQSGQIDFINISKRAIVETALKYGAINIILVHNHPSGTYEASNEDIIFTSEMFTLFKDLSIGLLDHIIVAQGSFFSFKEHGLMEEV